MLNLTDHDKKSELWLKIMAHLNELLLLANRKNENNLDINETTALRGRIKLIRELMRLSAPNDGTEPE